MADERDWRAWDHTSAQCSMIANTGRDPKKRPRPFTPAEFHAPLIARRLQQRREVRDARSSIALLRDVFIPPAGKTRKRRTRRN